jgi:hypothetical protein
MSTLDRGDLLCRVLLALALTIQGCSDDTSTQTDAQLADALVVDTQAVDAPLADVRLDVIAGDGDGGGCPGSFPFSGPSCCGAQGQRIGSADCKAGQWLCEAPGALCLCDGKPQAYSCSDLCGSDVFFEPTCEGGAWTCGPGKVKTSDCPPGTCWGEPGQCCDESGTPVAPVCDNGSWEWAAACKPENCS